MPAIANTAVDLPPVRGEHPEVGRDYAYPHAWIVAEFGGDLVREVARAFLRGVRVASWEELKERILKGVAEINTAPVMHRWRKFEAPETLVICFLLQ